MTDLTPKARKLRRDQTEAEKRLWYRLRNRQLGGYKFKRQYPVQPYIVDFFCEEKGLVVELDGGQHTPEKDKRRTECLENQGFQIVRFWNNDVLKNTEGVLQTILDKLNNMATISPHPNHPRKSVDDSPSPRGEGKNKRICLGKITQAHGVKGLVKILFYGDDPKILESAPLYAGKTSDATLELTLKNALGKYWLAEIKDVNDRTDAENLRGTELWIDRAAMPNIEDENSFYIEDLIGLSVVDETGESAGKIISVQNFGAGDLLEIKPDSGESFYLPFTNKTVIDIQSESILIHSPEKLA